MKLDLLTNATVVDDAIRFVTENRTKNGLMATEESKVSTTTANWVF
jgi:hypothetical protein